MKIAFIGFGLEPNIKEAINNKTYFLAEKLKKERKGKNTILIITNGERRRSFNHKGLKIRICGCGRSSLAFWKNKSQFINYASRILKKESPDIIHDVFGMIGTSIITRKILKNIDLNRIKTVKTIGAHGFPLRDLGRVQEIKSERGFIEEYLPSLVFDNQLIRHKIIKKFDNIICLSKHLSQEFKHKSKLEINNSIDLHYFLDYRKNNKDIIEKFVKDNKIKGKDVILYLGHLKVQKGIEYIIKAMPEILKQNKKAVFLFAFNRLGENEERYLKMIRKQGISKDKIIIKNTIDPRLAFSVSKVFLLPLLFQWGTQAQPDSLIEALACGCVPVVSKVESISEVVRHRRNGLLVKPFSHEDLSKKTLEILSDKKLYKKIQINTTKHLEKFDWKNNYQKFKKNYHNLLEIR